MQQDEPKNDPAEPQNGETAAKKATVGKAKAAGKLHELAEMHHDAEAIRQVFESGEYPYKTKI